MKRPILVPVTSGAETVVGGRFRLGDKLGHGQFGRVWRTHDLTLDRNVALKEVLLPRGLEAAERGRLVSRAMREARAAARLRHQGVVAIHDVIEEDKAPWIVMDLVPGPSLADYLRAQVRLPRPDAARLGAGRPCVANLICDLADNSLQWKDRLPFPSGLPPTTLRRDVRVRLSGERFFQSADLQLRGAYVWTSAARRTRFRLASEQLPAGNRRLTESSHTTCRRRSTE